MRDASVKSAQRVLEIIECLGRMRRPLRLKDIVEELRYPTSSVAVLLKCMTNLGYLHFDERTRHYALTGRLTALTSWVQTSSFESGALEEVLRGLQREAGELVVLAAENGLHAEYIRTYRSLGDGVQLYISPGTKRVLIQAGAGWLFLREKSVCEVTEIYRETIKAGHLTEAEYPLARLLARLEQSRGKDVVFASAKESVRPTAHWDGGLISTEIPVAPGSAKLAICIGGPAKRLESRLDTLAAMLRAARGKVVGSLSGSSG